MAHADSVSSAVVEIIAFHLGDQQFCIRTTSIREIRGWTASTPLPHAPAHIAGVMNLRGLVIPVVDLAVSLGVERASINGRSAIVVAEIGDSVVGLLVDRVSDILSISSDQIQSVPEMAISIDADLIYGLIPLENGMVCFLNTDRIFANH